MQPWLAPEEWRKSSKNNKTSTSRKSYKTYTRLMWAFQGSAGQYSKLNCFCDQPTEHVQKLPESHQLTLLTYDLIDYSGQREEAGVHTILFKPSQQALGRILQQRIEGKLTVLVRLKCTPQPEHIAEAIYLHHRKYLKNIAAVHYIGEAATRHTSPVNQSRYEESGGHHLHHRQHI